LGAEEALANSLSGLTSPKEEAIDFLTELDDEEILNATALKTWADATGFEILSDFVTFFERLRVSRYRQGRREVTLAISLAGGAGARTPKSVRDILGSLRI
jgi:hypothetical protein